MPNFNHTIRRRLTQSDGDAFVVTLAAYTANDCVGGPAKVFYSTGSGALLIGVEIQDNAVQNEPYIVHLFSEATTTTLADSAAMALVAVDGYVKIGEVTIAAGDYTTENGSDYSKAFVPVPAHMGLVADVSAGNIYVYLECTATPDYVAVDDLTIDFVFWID